MLSAQSSSQLLVICIHPSVLSVNKENEKKTHPSLKTFLPYDRVRGLISNVWFVVNGTKLNFYITGSVGLL